MFEASSQDILEETRLQRDLWVRRHTRYLSGISAETPGFRGRRCITAPVIDNASRLLLEENAQVLSQIAANLETVKIQDNVNLFLRTRINITTILNSMSGMPGIMSQMPPLPVTISEDLVTRILPSPSQAFIFSSPTGSTVKQEPRC